MSAQQHGDWKYYLDFFLYPPIALLIALATIRDLPAIAWFVLGFVFWTFAEYWVHRVLLHRLFWHGAHERHHRNPSEYVVFPLWQLPTAFFAIGLAFYLLGMLPAYAGFLAGYCWFLSMHHWLHHADLRRHAWLQRYAVWHNRHHKLNDRNYGITTPVWDVIFCTSR